MTENNDKKNKLERANKMTFNTHGFRVSGKFVKSWMQRNQRDEPF
jgi:hypothetical protein